MRKQILRLKRLLANKALQVIFQTCLAKIGLDATSRNEESTQCSPRDNGSEEQLNQGEKSRRVEHLDVAQKER